MWGDKYKNELLFVHQGTGHNKFWTIVYDKPNNIVIRRWGRIGTKGQSKSEPFTNEYSASQFIESKINSQKRDGYKSVDRATLDKMAIEAAIVGTQNKCHSLKWVELHYRELQLCDFTEINEDRLMDSECNPGLIVNVETKKQYDGETKFTLLFTLDQAYKVKHWAVGHHLTPVKKCDSIYSLTKKVEEAIGRSMSE